MSREHKYRFVFQHSATKDIVFFHFSLDEIVDREGVAIAEISRMRTEGWIIIAKDQFTGFKNNSGAEIYENDIIKINDGTMEKICFVEWALYDCAFKLRWGDYYFISFDVRPLIYSIEFLGTMHQNQELLNKE